MKAVVVGELKRNFDAVINMVKQGEEVTISSGKRKRESIAVLIPFAKYAGKHKRVLGILEKKASFHLKEGFKITDEELLSL